MLFILFLLTYASNLAADIEHRLVYDTHKLCGPLPAHFRTMHDSWLFKCRTGLEKLHASGSGQYAKEQLKTILRVVPSNTIILIDLRQECHGFVDGEPVSWIAQHNLINYGLPSEWIIADEKERLGKLSLTTVEIVAHADSSVVKQGIYTDLSIHRHEIYEALTEEALAAQFGLMYIRFTVPDKKLPQDQDVDRFVALIETLKSTEWLHIHCRAGRGRTTTFLAMYDMLINANDVEYDNIIKRQYRLGGVNFNEQPERLTFLKKFYAYARARAAGFTGPWSEWRAVKRREWCANQKQ